MGSRQMNRQGLIVAVAACCIGLAACHGDDAPQAPAAPSDAPAKAAGAPSANDATVRHRIHPSLPEFTFTLVGSHPAESDGVIRVRSIEIRRGAAAEPAQVIDGLDTETPVAAGAPALEVLDMNFDGYQDIRIVQFRPAGPNVPYLNWLFDPVSGRFLENRELNEIPSASFDPATREIRSSWRDGATRYGTHSYVFAEGRPVLVRKEERAYQAPGRYVLTVSRFLDGAWKTVEQREVREAEEAKGVKDPTADK
ncbi:MAG: hypothetical protein EHM59_19865 [Betaproteobacteria bacterium]|nr:MAG: hypothetical protein EHM59_19865 [Betaproteobacteria bacterium]